MIFVVRFTVLRIIHLVSTQNLPKKLFQPLDTHTYVCVKCAYQRIRSLSFSGHGKSKLTVFTDFTVFIYSNTSVVFITVLMTKCLFLFKIFDIS